MQGQFSSGQVNQDLENERKKCTFDVEEMARWWNDGEENLKAKRESGNYFNLIRK